MTQTLESTTDSSCPPLISSGQPLDPARVGRLRDSSASRHDIETLRERMHQDGYLFMPGMLNRADVFEARREVTDRLAANGMIDTSHPKMDAIALPGATKGFIPNIVAENNLQLAKVLYDGPMIAFFDDLFGQPTRHYDFTWFRTIGPGPGSRSHCDVVYMGRGERERLYTAWTPIGDIDFVQGGLMVLEGTNNHEKLKNSYGQMDVDSFCENKSGARAWGKSWGTSGVLKGDPNTIGRSLGGRWLTTEYRAGDVLIFSIFTVHASLDNRSQGIRLSSDSRYQPASAPADERWVGAHPIAHGDQGKRGKIC